VYSNFSHPSLSTSDGYVFYFEGFALLVFIGGTFFWNASKEQILILLAHRTTTSIKAVIDTNCLLDTNLSIFENMYRHRLLVSFVIPSVGTCLFFFRRWQSRESRRRDEEGVEEVTPERRRRQ
jgi:hypothetical protein